MLFTDKVTKIGLAAITILLPLASASWRGNTDTLKMRAKKKRGQGGMSELGMHLQKLLKGHRETLCPLKADFTKAVAILNNLEYGSKKTIEDIRVDLGQLRTVRSKLKDKENDLEKLKRDLNNSNKRKSELEMKLGLSQKQLTNANKRINELDGKMKVAAKGASKVMQGHQILEQRLQKALQELKQTRNALVQRKKDLKTMRTQKKKYEGRSTELNSQLEDEKRHSADLRQKLAKSHTESNGMDSLKKKYSALENKNL